MPHVDILYAQLQKRQVCSTFIQTCLQNFVKSINNVRENIPDIFNNTSCTMSEEPLAKRPISSSIDGETSLILKEVCDIIISHCCSRFEFTGHLAATLLTVVHSPVLNNASQLRFWKLLQIISFS